MEIQGATEFSSGKARRMVSGWEIYIIRLDYYENVRYNDVARWEDCGDTHRMQTSCTKCLNAYTMQIHVPSRYLISIVL